MDFDIPADKSEIKVEVISGGPGDGSPASVHWIGAGLVVASPFDVIIDVEKLILVPSGTVCDDGKPAVLTMEYTAGDDISNPQEGKAKILFDILSGETPVRVIASDKDKPFDSKAKVWFDGVVNLNETFDIEAANGGANRLKASTFVHILEDGTDAPLQLVVFHTSCSKPLNLGDEFGAVTLLGSVPE